MLQMQVNALKAIC